MKRMTREWIGKAEDDFRAAETLAAAGSGLHDQITFHCQQAAEKYQKALLEELGHSIPKTHDLEDLLALLLPQHASLGGYRRGLRFLTGFAVDPRYPLWHASKRQAAAALRWAGKVRGACRGLLGLPPPRPKRG
jgi:HEPN domain-containing protein